MNTRAPGFNPDDEPWDAFGDEPQEGESTAVEAYFVNATPGPWEPAYIPDDLDPLAECRRMLDGGRGRVYYVCAPKHPDSNEDGVTVIAITGNGPTGRDNATAISCLPELLEAVKLAYQKHHMGRDEIGWDELSEVLHNALNNAMGANGYLEWVATA